MTKNVRLSEETRARIANAALKHRFAPEIEKLRSEFAILAQHVYDVTMKKFRQQMDALPDGWLPTDDDMKVQIAGSVETLKFNGVFYYRHGKLFHVSDIAPSDPAPVKKRFRDKDKDRVIAVFNATDQFSTRHNALQNRAADLEKAIAEARKQTIATLDKFFSIGKLLEAWPEIEPFTKDIIPTPPAKLPAVPVLHLNNILGLPLEDKK